MTWEVILSAVGAVGGFEFIRWLVERIAHRQQHRRKAEAEADSVEFSVLRDVVEFLEMQLKEKEMRFAEQTELVRSLNKEIVTLTQEKGQTELELQHYRCIRPKCLDREPQNGY